MIAQAVVSAKATSVPVLSAIREMIAQPRHLAPMGAQGMAFVSVGAATVLRVGQEPDAHKPFSPSDAQMIALLMASVLGVHASAMLDLWAPPVSLSPPSQNASMTVQGMVSARMVTAFVQRCTREVIALM